MCSIASFFHNTFLKHSLLDLSKAFVDFDLNTNAFVSSEYHELTNFWHSNLVMSELNVNLPYDSNVFGVL
mgnify:CR=1 FL=1